jgi:hypothetical protein
MRQHVLEPALALGTPAWVTAGDFDLSRHVHRVRLPAPGTLRQLLDVVQDFAAAPLDRDRPLWAALLVEGLADGRAGYVAKSHHSVTDGLAEEHGPGRVESLQRGDVAAGGGDIDERRTLIGDQLGRGRVFHSGGVDYDVDTAQSRPQGAGVSEINHPVGPLPGLAGPSRHRRRTPTCTSNSLRTKAPGQSRLFLHEIADAALLEDSGEAARVTGGPRRWTGPRRRPRTSLRA